VAVEVLFKKGDDDMRDRQLHKIIIVKIIFALLAIACLGIIAYMGVTYESSPGSWATYVIVLAVLGLSVFCTGAILFGREYSLLMPAFDPEIPMPEVKPPRVEAKQNNENLALINDSMSNS